MAIDIVPVTCPRCGERQNQAKGPPNSRAMPVGPVACMVCQYEFSDDEYRAGLAQAQQEIDERLAQKAGRAG